jgi:hypothetical protein
MKLLLEKLQSRKLWLTVAGCATVIANEGFTSSAFWKVAVMIAGFSVGQGFADAGQKKT